MRNRFKFYFRWISRDHLTELPLWYFCHWNYVTMKGGRWFGFRVFGFEIDLRITTKGAEQ